MAPGMSTARMPLLPLPQAKFSIPDDAVAGGHGTSPFNGIVLDAAKRKNLPAWIREGLEKMEREKQKKEEREKFLQERELKRQDELKSKIHEDSVLALTRSRFDDTEEEEEEQDPDNEPEAETVSAYQPSSQEALELMVYNVMFQTLKQSPKRNIPLLLPDD